MMRSLIIVVSIVCCAAGSAFAETDGQLIDRFLGQPIDGPAQVADNATCTLRCQDRYNSCTSRCRTSSCRSSCSSRYSSCLATCTTRN